MPSNRELADLADKLAAELGRRVRTAGLSHAALTDLVEDLQEELAARSLEQASTEPAPSRVGFGGAVRASAAAEILPPAPPPSEPPPPVQEVKPTAIDGATGKLVDPPPAAVIPPPLDVYMVAPGKAITSLRGILAQGTVVTAKDFQNGQQTIDELLASPKCPLVKG